MNTTQIVDGMLAFYLMGIGAVITTALFGLVVYVAEKHQERREKDVRDRAHHTTMLHRNASTWRDRRSS